MQYSLKYHTDTIVSVAILMSTATMTAQLRAQESPLSQPKQPVIELLEKLEDSDSTDSSVNVPITSATVDNRKKLLSSLDRVGFGAATTGGSNEIVVSNIEEFIAAVSQPDNYVLLAPSLAGQTLYISDTININVANITIDGSDAPGAVFKPSESFQSSRVMMYFRQPNVIVSNITLEANYFPDSSSNNVGGIRFSRDRIWVNKVTVSGLWDDAFDMVHGATNATFSKVKTYNTDKSMNLFYPHESDKRVSIHSSDLAGRQRNPWNQGAKYVHLWNNYIHESSEYPWFAGTQTGYTRSQWIGSNYSQTGVANTISEHNYFRGENTFLAYTETGNAVLGFIHSNNDDLGEGSIIGGSNVTFTTNPSLFPIPYEYNLLPTNQVKAYVLTNAGASLK